MLLAVHLCIASQMRGSYHGAAMSHAVPSKHDERQQPDSKIKINTRNVPPIAWSAKINSTMDLLHSPTFPSRVEELLNQHHVPGIAIAVVQGETIASAGFGMASLDPPRKFTPDTLIDIASASKSLTAASVGLLVEDNKYPDIKYEATMSSLLPEDFVMPGEGYTEGVTVEDILSHRSGMAP